MPRTCRYIVLGRGDRHPTLRWLLHSSGGITECLTSKIGTLRQSVGLSDVFIVDFTGCPVDDAIHTVRVARALNPWLPVIGYVRLTPEIAKITVAAVQAGLSAVILEDHTTTVEPIVRQALAQTLAARLDSVVAAIPSRRMRAFVRHGLLCDGMCSTVPDVCAQIGEPEWAVRRSARDAGLPTPRWILGAARTLVAARHLLAGHTVWRVASTFQFGTPARVRTSLSHYFGVGTKALEVGGLLPLVVQFQDALKPATRIPGEVPSRDPS